MATISFESNIYSAFKFKIYSGNLSANLYSQGNLELVDSLTVGQEEVIQLRVRRGFNSRPKAEFSLECVGGFLYKGGVARRNDTDTNGTQRDSEIKVVSSYTQYVDPTFVRIDIDALMNEGLPEQTDVTIQMEEGFLIEDTYKYPSALGYSLPQNNNYLTFRTPTRLNPLGLGITSEIDPDFNYRLRYFNNNNNQTVYSLFDSPNLRVVGTFAGVIASASAFELDSIIGAIYPENINDMLTLVTVNSEATRLKLFDINLMETLSTSFIDNVRVRYFDTSLDVVSNQTTGTFNSVIRRISSVMTNPFDWQISSKRIRTTEAEFINNFLIEAQDRHVKKYACDQ